ncbi:MAG TPA: CPBP family intramembrane metalloprotease [bacterium]|nr:CPBP family intramembrane metalloprotease [bacterium]
MAKYTAVSRGLMSSEINSNPAARRDEKIFTAAFLVCAAPFFLNDFSNIFVKDWRVWLLIDYSCVKLFPLLVVIYLLRRGVARPSDFGLTAQRAAPFAATFFAMVVVGTVMDQNLLSLFRSILGGAHLGGMPEITSGAWNWIDLTFGLLMVGVFEELVFRGMAHAVLSRRGLKPAAIVAVSAVIFGLIHWSSGVHAFFNTALIGAVFMLFYLRTRSLPALMLAHFMIDFIAFAGVIPDRWFKII